MSGDQTTNESTADDVLAQAMRDAEKAVERVRAAGRDG
jgi:hypothetical protein